MCIIYKQIFYFQRGVSNRDDRRSNYLQNKYVKPQCYEFDFNMISGLPAIVKNVYDYYFTGWFALALKSISDNLDYQLFNIYTVLIVE